MKKISGICIALTFIAVSEFSFATTYKCVDEGVISYSDTPCKGKILVINNKTLKSIQSKPAPAPTSSDSRTKQALKTLEEARHQREAQREIKELERDIELLTQERNEQLEEIKKQLEYPEVDVNDDDDELRVMDLKKSLNNEMSSISAQFDQKIMLLRKKINTLRSSN